MLVAGCSVIHFGRHRRTPPGEEQALRLGTVALVNEDEHFALIEATLAPSPVAGTLLRTYAGDTVSAELRATGVRRQPFLVADLVSGKPGKGDLVVQPPRAEDNAPPPIPKAEPASAPTPAPKHSWTRWLSPFRVGK